MEQVAEQSNSDTFEELSDRIVEVVEHQRTLLRELRGVVRRMEALRPWPNPLLHHVEEAHARMNAVRSDDESVRCAREDRHASAEASGAEDIPGHGCFHACGDTDHASAEASSALARMRAGWKLKPLAVALAIGGQK